MKKWSARLRDYTVGATIATLFLASTSAFGAPALKSINAVFNNIKVVVDGITIQPKDVEGKAIEPFIVDGTTYLPLRAIATAFGKPVQWDQKTNTVLIGDNSQISGRIIPLQELTPYTGAIINREELNSFMVLQKTYQPAINDFYASFYAGEKTGYNHSLNVSYLLHGNYKTLKAKFVSDDNTTNTDGTDYIVIYGDGKELYSAEAGRGKEPVDIELNIVGIKELQINGWITPNGHLYDVTLTEIDKK